MILKFSKISIVNYKYTLLKLFISIFLILENKKDRNFNIQMINFISDIINSAGNVVDSTGDAVDKIISISNPLAKRENESTEDYQRRLELLERQTVQIRTTGS